MKTTSRWLSVIALAAVAMIAVSARAELMPQQKLMARRAAEADAYRKLAERVMGLQISSRSTVRDFATESDRISASLNHFIKGIRIDPTSTVFYEDGSCEVTAEVTIEKVVTTLKTVCDKYYDGEHWTKDSFEEIKKRTTRDIISEVGCGAATEETLMPDPASLEYVEPLIAGGAKKRKLPSIYLTYGARERLKAKRAAEMDAYRKLIERIYGLQIDSSTMVRDFVTVSDEIRLSSQHALKGVRTGAVCYQADGIVQVQMSLTLEKVVTMLQKICDAKYDGKKWTRSRIANITKNSERKSITVVGMGVLDMRPKTPKPGRTILSGSGSVSTGGHTGHRHIETTTILEETVVIVLD